MQKKKYFFLFLASINVLLVLVLNMEGGKMSLMAEIKQTEEHRRIITWVGSHAVCICIVIDHFWVSVQTKFSVKQRS